MNQDVRSATVAMKLLLVTNAMQLEVNLITTWPCK
jgi:hypothetical protein